jgi:hypothetical protein
MLAQPFLLKTHGSRADALNSTRANSRRVLSRASYVVAASTSSRSRLDELIIATCRDDNLGVGSTRRGEIESMIDKLLLLEEENESKKTKNTDDSRLSARWKLLWTSEQETLFLLEKFNNSNAYQTIDVRAKTLSNTVEFAGGNTFLVDSEIEIADERKVKFKFVSAGLKFSNGFTLPVPPVGKGWFDNVYVSDEYRVARDSRGDTLIVERCP